MLGCKVIYVRCISCSYNNVAKGIRLLDKKKQFLFIQENFHASQSYLKIYTLKWVNIVSNFVICWLYTKAGEAQSLSLWDLWSLV